MASDTCLDSGAGQILTATTDNVWCDILPMNVGHHFGKIIVGRLRCDHI